jgi:hypothetical protein
LSWKRRLHDPIVLPDGRKLVTLLDAATYATKLPKSAADTAEWQAAIESLMLIAELTGPTMFARIGVITALNRHIERAFDPFARIIIKDAESWREIDDRRSALHARPATPASSRSTRRNNRFENALRIY